MGGRELSPSITTSRAAGGIGCLPPPPPVQLRNNMFSSLPPSFYLRLFLVLLFCLSLHVTAASWYPAHAAPGTGLHLAACRLPVCSDTCSCVCTWVCMCVCMCVCTRACMCVHAHMHAHYPHLYGSAGTGQSLCRLPLPGWFKVKKRWFS